MMFKKNIKRVTGITVRQDAACKNLSCIFEFAKIVGVNAFHTHWSHILFGMSLQVVNVMSLLCWVYVKNVFVEKSIYGFAWGVLHVATTFTSFVAALATWKKHDKVKSALRLLSCLKLRKTGSFIWLPVFNVTTVLTVILFDLFLDRDLSFISYLQVFVYYLPLLQILTASSQFVGVVMVCEQCLSILQKKADDPAISGIALMKDYNTLYAACQLINEAFSIQNFFAVSSHGSAFALSSYIFIIAGLNYFPPTRARKKIWVSLLLSIFHISYTLLIFKPCQSLENNGRRFLETLYDRIPLNSAEDHVLHRPVLKKIRFSACGFFRINFAALGSIVTTLFTYQVILLQFAQAENDI